MTSEVSRPNPDPTSLTTEQLHREMGWIKELIEQHIVSERNNLADRKELFLEMQATGTKLLNERIDGSLREMQLTNEAAKMAVAKSEAGYEKRFEHLNELRQTVTDREIKFMTATESRALHKAHEDKLNELTNRFNLRDGRDSGEDTSRSERRAGQSEIRANVSLGIAAVTVLGTLFLFLSNLSSKVDRNSDTRVIPTAPMPATPSPSR